MDPPTQRFFWNEGRQKWAGSSMLRRHRHTDKLYWVPNRWIHHEDLCHIPVILPHQILGAAILSKEQTPFYLSQSGFAQAHFATVCLTHSQCFGDCREQIWFPEAPPRCRSAVFPCEEAVPSCLKMDGSYMSTCAVTLKHTKTGRRDWCWRNVLIPSVLPSFSFHPEIPLQFTLATLESTHAWMYREKNSY